MVANKLNVILYKIRIYLKYAKIISLRINNPVIFDTELPTYVKELFMTLNSQVTIAKFNKNRLRNVTKLNRFLKRKPLLKYCFCYVFFFPEFCKVNSSHINFILVTYVIRLTEILPLVSIFQMLI